MPRRRWSADQMRELLQEQERSGLSLKAFADGAGVAYTTLAWWRTRLRREEATRLVPVRVHEDTARVEIVVGDVVVRVAGGDEAWVARLVRAIAAC